MVDLQEKRILGLGRLGEFLQNFVDEQIVADETSQQLEQILKRAEQENPWFTQENLRFALRQWSVMLKPESLKEWLSGYRTPQQSKKVGLILAGNIPLAGFHDVVAVLLSNHTAVIKLSSKDRLIIPFLLKIWQEFSGVMLSFNIVEKLQDYDAVIATGSNNTARYLEFYFKDTLSVIRKNRTSVAVVTNDTSDEELQLLSDDIFRYFGLGCRNVTRIFIPEDFKLDRLFENFMAHAGIINHHKYANNYDYNKAVYLLNQDKFWDNNFVMLREDENLFGPLSVLNFSRYQSLSEVKNFIENHRDQIQAVVADPALGLGSVNFGEAQKPALDVYADNVDTMKFLEVI